MPEKEEITVKIIYTENARELLEILFESAKIYII